MAEETREPKEYYQTKKSYTLKTPYTWGPKKEYGPGDVVKLTPHQASGMLFMFEKSKPKTGKGS